MAVFIGGKKIQHIEHGFVHNNKQYIHHSQLHFSESAFFRLSIVQIISLVVLVLTLVLFFVFQWSTTLLVVITALTILYFADLLFNLFLIIRSFAKSPEIVVTDEEVAAVSDDHWVPYTVFCPLYHEWKVVPQFVQAIQKLDYPKDKLQVLLLLEEDDTRTIEEIKKLALPPFIETVVVPHSFPKTKPKALNYGLKYATGDYVVIYDAEDIPEPAQLKKAIIAFAKSDRNVICIQAKLNFYNPHQNILTKVFTAEYSLWFDLVLTGLQSINAPIPLGGTSNHFRRADLHKIKGWDSFNVTEDCDLGIRLVKHGYKTAIVDSTTYEEANSHLGNWFNQRTRWIKGYIQTYFVHMRNPFKELKGARLLNFLAFQLVVGGKVLSMLINPLMWMLTITYIVLYPTYGNFLERFYPTPVLYMAVFSLFIGNFLQVYYYMLGCSKREHDDIVKYVFLVPFYWLFMSAATVGALLNFIFDPHFWAKTKHGLHSDNKKVLAKASQILGHQLTP